MNTMTGKLTLAAALLLALASLGAAQDPGGQGRGGGRGRMMMMGGGGGGLMLLGRKDVQKDLALTADQMKKLEALRAKADEDRQAAMENARAQGDFEGVREAMAKMMEDYQKKVDEIVTPDQSKRLKEIDIQIRGGMALYDEKVQKELGITAAQKSSMEDLSVKQREAMRTIFEKRQSGELDNDQVQQLMTKNRDIMGAELIKLLTPEQADKFKAMQGKKFENTEPTQFRMGRGGG